MRLPMLFGAAAMLALCSFEAGAQFTGVVAPAKAKVTAVADTTPKTVAQARDSVAKVDLGNMKDWVDSAASSLGVPVAPTAVDTTTHAATPPAPTPAQQPATPAPRATTEFHEGAAAPNTATPIPLIAVLGAASLVAGLWLLRRRRA